MLKPGNLITCAGGLIDVPMGGGGSGGNATVPNDAPIQPAQAFVDFSALLNGPVSINTTLDFSNKGATKLGGYPYANLASPQFFESINEYLSISFALGSGVTNINLSGNALETGAMEDVLSQIKDMCYQTGLPPCTVDLTGNPGPIYQGSKNNTAWLIARGGWRIKFTLNGVAVDLDPAGTCSYVGNSLSEADVNALLAYLVSSTVWSELPGLVLNISGGTNAAPAGQGLTDKQTLIDNGWTVTTN